MEIKIQNKDGITVISLNGEFTVFFQEEIENKIFETIESGKKKIILDLTEVNYLDSSGISIIVTAAQRMKGKINIVGSQPNVKYVLELAEIGELINFYDNLDSALQTLK